MPDLPAEYSLPDLSDLFTPNMLTVIVDMQFGQHFDVPTDREGHACWMGLVRFTDKAVMEYESSRIELNRFASARNKMAVWSSLLRGSNHLETCVSATSRALIMRSDFQDRGYLVSRQAVTEADEQSVRQARNYIEHVNEEIADGKLREDLPYFLSPEEDRLQVGSRNLLYSTLAKCIRECYETVQAARKS